MTVIIGNNDECVQCGESKAAIKESQRKGEPFYCCITDYYGEVSHDWERHKFVWTQKDQDAFEAEQIAINKQIDGFVEFMKEQEAAE